ncbi:hypothetical protein [Streptomyces noursei]|uniref:hypothetical protein n=1 Tax=Streptomyces noursei TaxID=1971 RepID=UPI00045EE913|nr:hypothetical protein [Streptomyces noursei]AIA01192.1 hypothetical protein DC74_668 [Streptomyces noursei]
MARGWVQALATFMASRSAQGLMWEEAHDGQPAALKPEFGLGLGPLREDANATFGLRVMRPDIQVRTAATGGGRIAWVHDGRSSRALVEEAAQGQMVVQQEGPRRLAEELTSG